MPASRFTFEVSPLSAGPSLDRRRHGSASSTRGAFSLVEVVLSLGIVAFCMVSLLGLLQVGVSTQSGSTEQTAAVNIAAAVVADLRATAFTAKQSSPRFGIPAPPYTGLNFTYVTSPTDKSNNPATMYVDGDGVGIAENATSDFIAANPATSKNNQRLVGAARYRVTITWTVPDTAATGAAGSTSSPQGTATLADVRVTWPPTVAPVGTASVRPAGVVEMMCALNRPPPVP